MWIHSSQILVPNSLCELMAPWEDKDHHSNAVSFEMEISCEVGYALTFTSQARGISDAGQEIMSHILGHFDAQWVFFLSLHFHYV